MESEAYLAKHKIIPLLNNMTAHLLFEQPEDSKDYMVKYLQRLHESKKYRKNYPCLFDETNLLSVYHMLDPVDRGFINKQQYTQAMVTLGVAKYDQYPPGNETDKIFRETFLAEAREGLRTASMTHD